MGMGFYIYFLAMPIITFAVVHWIDRQNIKKFETQEVRAQRHHENKK
jgi:hypothetical protein